MSAQEQLDLSYFLEEGCPVLALALHRLTNLPLAVLYDDGTLDDWGQGPEPTPVHAFVFDPETGDAIDVKGRRTIERLKEDFSDLIEPRVEEVGREELESLMGNYRPFYAEDAETRGWAEVAISDLRLV